MKRKLQGIAAQAVDRPLTPFEFGTSWSRPTAVVSLLGPAALELTDYAASFAARREWGEKFSAQFVQDRMVPIVLALHDSDIEGADRLVAVMFETMEAFDAEQTVYVPVSGVRIAVPEFPLGEIILRSADDGLLEELRARLADMRTKPPEGSATYEDDRPNDTASKLAGKTAAVFRVVAEPIRAAERAEQATRRALGVLTFCHAALALSHPAGDAVAGLDSEVPALLPWVGMVSNAGFYESIRAHPSSWPIEITEQRVRQMDYFGLSELSWLLATADGDRSEMERALLRAVDWFAQSQAQATPANRLLNLITCLETLVGPTKNAEASIVQAISERTALILLDNYEQRRKLKQAIAGWYDARSGITHGDEDIVSELTAKQVRPYVVELVRFLLAHRHDLRDRAALSAWFERSRLGGRMASTGTKPTIAELREQRGWSQVDLADRAEKEPRMIDHWERNGPDIVALRLLADVFSVAPEAIALAPHNRLLTVRGHRILLAARQDSGDEWTARVGGWSFGDGEPLPRPDDDAEDPNGDPLEGWMSWQTTAGIEGDAFDALADRIISAMTAAFAMAAPPARGKRSLPARST
jgi:transcriptional regulator with XRE-family HTH domain